MTPRLSIGIDILDRRLDGGLPSGSLVLLTAPAASQSELFLYEFTRPRGTLWLSFLRPQSAVERGLNSTPVNTPSQGPTVVAATDDTPLKTATNALNGLPGRSNVILDPINTAEQLTFARYRDFLTHMDTILTDSSSLGFLHGFPNPDHTQARQTTAHFADVIFSLEFDTDGRSITTQLTVRKFRNGTRPSDPIKVDLASGVEVDTTRDIA